MGTLTRGKEIIADLESVGVRATTDPGAIAPPCVLVPPPNYTFNLGCGASVTWQLVALGTSTVSADSDSWAELDDLVDSAIEVLDLESAPLVAYSVNGKSYPAYLLTFTEAV